MALDVIKALGQEMFTLATTGEEQPEAKEIDKLDETFYVAEYDTNQALGDLGRAEYKVEILDDNTAQVNGSIDLSGMGLPHNDEPVTIAARIHPATNAQGNAIEGTHVVTWSTSENDPVQSAPARSFADAVEQIVVSHRNILPEEARVSLEYVLLVRTRF